MNDEQLALGWVLLTKFIVFCWEKTSFNLFWLTDIFNQLRCCFRNLFYFKLLTQISPEKKNSISTKENITENVNLKRLALKLLIRTGKKKIWMSPENRPFPSSPQLPFQSEAKCEVFVMKISFHSY